LKNILIIYPHWIPANLAGVQRPRLIGNYLELLGWHPILLTVDASYYEEPLDLLMEKTVSDSIEVIYTKASRVRKPRIIGDIGLRAFPYLKKSAMQICRERNIDFIWIPIPSFYTAILGRLIHEKTGIPYGIDYIDPWVRDLTNQNSIRARCSQWLARILEPYAVKKASLISGVSTPYYWPVIERNFKTPPVHVGMPYGFDPNDHKIVLADLKTPWDDVPDVKPWVYAGAFLPNSHLFIQAFFRTVAEVRERGKWDGQVRLYFIGTGPYPAKRITAYAKDYGLEDIVTEYCERFPYLHVLNFLAKADRVLLFGSTEKHYTASKTFQCLLSKRPVLAMLHEASSAVKVFEETGASTFLMRYAAGDALPELVDKLTPILTAFQRAGEWKINTQPLEKYTAKSSAAALVLAINQVLEQNDSTQQS